MHKLVIAAALTLTLTACSSKPPECAEQSFFYNDIPGCKEAVEKWSKEHPEDFAKWNSAKKKEAAELGRKLVNKILEPGNNLLFDPNGLKKMVEEETAKK